MYGVPAAYILLRHRASILAAKGSDHRNIKALWGETIRKLASFISLMGLVIERQDEGLDLLRDTRDNLVSAFDAVVDRFGAQYDKGETVEPIPGWDPDPLPLGMLTFHIELKDDIWRL